MEEKNFEISSGDRGELIVAPSCPYRPRDPKSYSPNIGLIGCGPITTSHLRAYSAAHYRVVALCDVNLGRALDRQREFYPDAEVYSDYRELLARPDIQVVDIATQPAERAKIIEDALLSDKHVLSQKPFVTDLDTGERLVELAERAGLRLAVNQNGRWSPHFSYIREAILAGHVGDVLGIHFGVHWNHDFVAGTPFDEIHHVVLYDFAIHWFDALSYFLGAKESTRVFASVKRASGQTAKPPLLGQALVEYEGSQATLAFDAFTKSGTKDSTIVTGTKGTLYSTGPDLGHQTVTLSTPEGSGSPHLEGTWFSDGFHGTMAELLCAIEDEREPSNSARDNLKSLALCFAAVRSANTGLPQVPGLVRELGSK
jgi:predicted dehydrogenase